MKRRTFFTALLVAMLLTALLTPFGAAQEPKATEKTPTAEREPKAHLENIGASLVTAVTPFALPVGSAFDLCFTVNVVSPDVEYMDYFDIDLPDGWTVNWISGDSAPPANGCSGALPPVPGVAAGNLLYWQSTGYPPATGCGAWNGGSGGTDFDFCANVTIPDDTGAPWMFPWFIEGDGFGGDPHTVSGSFGPVNIYVPSPLFDDSTKAAPEMVEASEPFTYTIHIENTGDAPATSAVMTDALPAEVSFVDGTLACDTGNCWYDDVSHTVYWTGSLGVAMIPPLPEVEPLALGGGTPQGVAPEGALALSSVGKGGAAEAVLNMGHVLWDQPSNGTGGLISQFFPDFGAGVYSGDDFDVGGTGWLVDTIFIDGDGSNTLSGAFPFANSLNWAIYPDVGGAPAGFPGGGGEYFFMSLLPGDPAITISGDFDGQATVDLIQILGGPLYLPPGTWWLVFYPDLAFGLQGQWFWDRAGTTNGYSSNVIDPTGLAGLPSVWTPWDTVDPTYYDLAFRLDGYAAAANIEFQVTPDAAMCGDSIVNEATIDDPGAPFPTTVEATTMVYDHFYASEDFEGAFPPAGWSLADNAGTGNYWDRNDALGVGNECAYGSGYSAAADPTNTIGAWDAELYSPDITLGASPGQFLRFASNFQDYAGNGDAWLDVTTDGGTSWDNLLYKTDDDTPGGLIEEFDLAGYAGETISFRWTYIATDTTAWFWHIDDVLVAECILPELDTNPPPLGVEVCPDGTDSINFDICNTSLGTLPLDFTWLEGEPVGDEQFQIDLQVYVTDTQLLGAEFVPDGAGGGHYWVTGGNSGLDPNRLYQYDIDGNWVATYDQSSLAGWGWRDLAYDGTYLYGSDTTYLTEIDPATGLATGNTVPCPENPCRALAYDPASDHFWTQNFGGPLYEFDRTGAVINTFDNDVAAYGAAWDSLSPGGPFVWVWSQDGPDNNQLVTATQIDPTTGIPTGLSFLGSRIGGGDNLAGGALISDQIIPGMAVFVGLHQAEPDSLVGYRMIAEEIPWLDEIPMDGSVAAGDCQNVEFVYDATGMMPGTYMEDVELWTNDPLVPSMTLPVQMTVWATVADVDFDWSPMTGTVGSMVYFTASATAGDLPITYEWDFGDGFGDVGMEVSHAFASAGDFDVELTVSDACAAPTAMHTIPVESGVGQYFLPIILRDYP